jgi:hypothetical protein
LCALLQALIMAVCYLVLLVINASDRSVIVVADPISPLAYTLHHIAVVLGLMGSLGYDIYKFGGGLLLLLMALSGMILSLFFTIGFTVLALKRVGALLSKANPPDGLLLLNFYPM